MSRKIRKTSAEEAMLRFGTPEAAEKYAVALNGTKAHQRELRCIKLALAGLPAGSKVLDCPCGTGRLIPYLAGLGYHVVAGDSSPHMTEIARKKAADITSSDRIRFLVTSVFDTGFTADTFDAVICNRLFHHFGEADVRRMALTELRRICTGTIVVSFFCNLAFDALVFHLKCFIKRKMPSDRIPIGYNIFNKDIESAGLRIVRSLAARPGISPQWYLALERATGS
jgi:SAM-dependent methyltransferase